MNRKDLAELSWLASPAAMAERMTAGLPRPFRRARHLDAINALLVDLTFGRVRRAIVETPPQHGKSTLDSHWWPAWGQELHALGAIDRGDFMLVTHERNYGGLWGGRTRDALAANAEILRTRIDPSTESKTEWRTLAGGGMFSGGIKGGVTGRSATQALGLDDPLKAREAQSEAARDEVWKFWLEDAQQRLHPDAPVLITTTRFHEADLVGRLLSPEYDGDPDEWVVLRIPAVAEPKDGEPDPLGRAAGEPLVRPDVDQTPEEALAWLRSVERTIGPYAWSGQFQQRPSEPEGSILRRSWWRQWRADVDAPDPRNVRWLASLDSAFKDTADSSYVVLGVWAYEQQGRVERDAGGAVVLAPNGKPKRLPPRRWLVDLVRARLSFTATKLLVRAGRDAWPQLGTIVVEDKANGPAVVDDLKSSVAGLDSWNPDRYGSKVARAHAITGELLEGCLYLPEPGTEAPRVLVRLRELAAAENVDLPTISPEWVGGFLDETGDFPGSAHDDQVDMTTQAILWIRERAPRPAAIYSAARRKVPGVRAAR